MFTSYSNGNSFSDGQSMLTGEKLNTEPWYWRLMAPIPPGAHV